MKLKDIAVDTLNIIDRGYYINPDQEKIDISESLRKAEEDTVLYKPDDFEGVFESYNKSIADRTRFQTEYEVTGETSMEAMERLSEWESNLACLNFASAKNPGGGFMGGAQAQEESLARSSGLYYCISQRSMMYSVNRNMRSCLYTDHMIYSPGVPFFKNDHGKLLPRPYLTAMLTVPAVNAGVVKQQGHPDEIARIDEVMMARMDKLLTIAALHGHEVLVLGAWGSGVFRNPADKVAGYFKYHLKENKKFEGIFRKVVFAVLDKTSGQTTINAFKERFEK
ncbi:MAG: hypothetical protein JWO03_337 [Bacteroidetes bacterium]|nr:hypothetical protein [Bacteroidota bacterium]